LKKSEWGLVFKVLESLSSVFCVFSGITVETDLGAYRLTHEWIAFEPRPT
jgi:hypothetical protein